MSALVPAYEDVLAACVRRAQLNIRTVVPGVVVSYVAATNMATVQPGPSSVTVKGEAIPLPVVEAPVCFPMGGGFAITWPLVPGDHVLLLCADRSIERWRLTGAAYKPESLRTHTLSDAFAVPFGAPAPDPVPGSSATDLVIVGAGGVALRVTPAGTITIAEGLTQAAAARVGDAVGPSEAMDTWMSQVAAFINGATPGSISPAAPASFATITEGSERVQVG